MTSTRNPNLNLSDQSNNSQSAAANGAAWASNLGKSRLDLSVPRTDEWYTGPTPELSICPGAAAELRAKGGIVVSSLPIPDLTRVTRQETLAYFKNTWVMTEILFGGLVGDEPFYRPPYHGLRHPLIFYYVHPACLYINKLRLAGLLDQPVDPYIETLFETGVDEMSWDDMSKNEIEWPTLDVAHAYRKRVYNIVEDIIMHHPGLNEGHGPITPRNPLWALFMGFEHERIHLETSSVLMRELPLHLVSRPPAFPADAPSSLYKDGQITERELDWVQVPATQISIGRPFALDADLDADEAEPFSFGWDNEFGHREADVEAFQAGRYLITNGQYLAFVRDGGYTRDKDMFWTTEGLAWRNYRNVKWPTFWVADGPQGLHQYKLRTIYDCIDLPLDWPCVVNYHEATAFAAWLDARENGNDETVLRLPTEAEHYAMRALAAKDHEHTSVASNNNLRHGSEGPIGLDIAANSKEPSDKLISDLFGNVWQWHRDHFHPLPGNRIDPLYDDFSTPCYDGEHQMIIGGSFISTGDEASRQARFHFRPHFFQHAGFRLVRARKGNDGAVVEILKDELGRPVDWRSRSNNHRSDKDAASAEALQEQTRRDYGTYLLRADAALSDLTTATRAFVEQAETFDRLLARLAALEPDRLRGHALDVGSATGGRAYDLAHYFDTVTAVELSEPLHARAREIKAQGRLNHQSRDLDLDRAALDRIICKKADPVSLPAEYRDFDLVLLDDVITRVVSPMAILSRLGGERGLVAPGGLLILLTDWQWQGERYCPIQMHFDAHKAIAKLASLGLEPLSDKDLAHTAIVQASPGPAKGSIEMFSRDIMVFKRTL